MEPSSKNFIAICCKNTFQCYCAYRR